jgi:cardiolipin synthase A/B
MATQRSRIIRKAKQAKEGYPWWVLLLSTFGAVALVGVVITLFFAMGRRTAHLRMSESPAVGSVEFLRSVAGIAGVPVRSGGTVRLLNNGEFFPALVKAIREARHNVNVLVYIWEPGHASDEVFAALIDRAKAGVEVRVLLDGFGGMKAPSDRIEALKKAGGHVETFRSPQLGKFTRFYKRNHRRAVVIDGAVGFTGGAAIADKWLGNAENDSQWRDVMVEVTGPAAATLQSAFVASWAHSTGELLTGPAIFPAAETHAAGEPLSFHLGIASAPSSEDHPLRLLFFQTFASARKTLYIATPYFVPDQATRMAVAERARRGVDVRLLLPDEHTDADLIRYTSQRYYEPLLAAGVRIYEYRRTMMHTKAVVVDGIWSLIGSANMDIRSVELNQENVLGFQDAGFARELEAALRHDWSQAREIRLADWQRRGPLQRFNEWSASLFAEQY